jgi:membrane protease YdiL (CAAX protease family)
MPGIPDPDSQFFEGTIAIAVMTLAFLAYYVFAVSRSIDSRIRNRFHPEAASIRLVLLHRLTGTFLFGGIPFFVILFVYRMPVSNYGTNTGTLPESMLWWIPAALMVIIVNYFASGNKSNLKQYPQIRVSRWNAGLLFLSALSWVTYLLGYEFLFRGFLLFSCLESFGYWPALIINVSLYSLAHLPKGPRETLASLIFGLILCLITIKLGALWFALLTHITLALSNEWLSISRHPEMKGLKQQMNA